MSTINDTDLFVIERSGTNYQVRSDEMSTLNDTDLFVVERDGVQYKVEATDVTTSGLIETPVEVLTPLNGAGLNEGDPYNPISSDITTVGPGTTSVYETGTIVNVNSTAGGQVLTFLDDSGFDKFEVGDQVQPQLLSEARLATTGGSPSGTPPTTSPLSNAFDGDDSTSVMLQSGGDECTWTFTQPIKGSTFEMYGASNYVSGSGAGIIEVNGANAGVVPGTTPGWGDFSSVAGGEFRTLRMTRSNGAHNPYIVKFRVDGVELVDPYAQTITAIDSSVPSITVESGYWAGSDGSGAFNPNEVWSSTVTCDKTLTTGSLVDLFNGQANTQVGMGTGAGNRFILTFTNPITNVRKVEIGGYTYGNDSSYNSYQMNGQPIISGAFSAYKEEMVLYEGNGTTLSSMEIIASNSGVPPWIKWIRVNGVLLVDAGIANPEAPDTTVSKTIVTDATITLSDDTELSNIIGPLSQVDETGEVKTPVTSEIASVAGNTLTFNSPNPDLQYFSAGDELTPSSVVSSVDVTDAEAIAGDQIPSKGGKYKGLHDMDGSTYNYFYGGNTGRMSWSNNGNSEYTSAQASLTDGYSNTQNSTNQNTDKLLQYVKALSFNGYSDWFVCAKEEFDTIDGFQDHNNQFFSSSQVSEDRRNEAWGYNSSWRFQDKNTEFITPYYRKEAASTPPTINLTSLTVADPANYPVGTNIIQPSTGATAKIRNVEGNALGLKDVVGTFIEASIQISNASPINVVSVDIASNTMTVDAAGFAVGAPIVGSPLTATAAEVNSRSGNSIEVSGVAGTWIPGLFIKGAEITANAPTPADIVFTSSNGGTTEYSGTDSTLESRTWTLESGDSSIGPWSLVGIYEDTSAGQDGSVNWTGHPVLEQNKFYRVKVKYASTNAVAIESTFNTFKTGA